MSDSAFGEPMPPHGLVRLPIQALPTLRLQHLLSGIHEESSQPAAQACGRPTSITGYTEWTAAAGSPVTLGWDWEMQCELGQVLWRRVGLPFTNVLLVDRARQDIAWQQSLRRLADLVDAMAWAESTRAALCTRYAWSGCR